MLQLQAAEAAARARAEAAARAVEERRRAEAEARQAEEQARRAKEEAARVEMEKKRKVPCLPPGAHPVLFDGRCGSMDTEGGSWGKAPPPPQGFASILNSDKGGVPPRTPSAQGQRKGTALGTFLSSTDSSVPECPQRPLRRGAL